MLDSGLFEKMMSWVFMISWAAAEEEIISVGSRPKCSNITGHVFEPRIGVIGGGGNPVGVSFLSLGILEVKGVGFCWFLDC